MGAKSAPASPSIEPSDTSSYTSPTGVCCWCEDYEKEISENASGRYFERYYDGVPSRGNSPKRFKLFVGLLADRIRVEVRYSFENRQTTTPDQLTAVVSALQEGARSWNNKIAIEIEDPECGSRVLPVEFEALRVTSGQHYKVALYQEINFDPFREHVLGDEMRILPSTNAWVYSHEHAHCFGLPDEYPYSDEQSELVVYIRPDRTADPAINVELALGAGRDRNVMSDHGNATRRKRHGYAIAIEVQALLTARLGRTIRCKVVSPAE